MTRSSLMPSGWRMQEDIITNIVGKYGPQVQALLKKAAGIEIDMICPLHGPVWRSDLDLLLEKYDQWSRYEAEEDGVLLVYGSMYGNTENAVEVLAAEMVEQGMKNIKVYDASVTDCSYLIAEHSVIAESWWQPRLTTQGCLRR